MFILPNIFNGRMYSTQDKWVKNYFYVDSMNSKKRIL